MLKGFPPPLNLADVCWKSVLGTWKCEANLENQATFFFTFQSWHPFQSGQNVAWGWFVYIINWLSLALSGFVSKGKFDSDFKPSRGSRVFCNQIPGSVAKGAYLLCSDVHLNLAHFSTTAPYLLRLQEDFVVRLSCRDNELFLRAFQTTSDIF